MMPFHHARAIRAESAGLVRWPRVSDLRSETTAGRRRWAILAGPFRTRRAAFRAARQQRDAKGIHYEWFPGALLYGVTFEHKSWWVLTRPARGKPQSETRRIKSFADVLPDTPF